MITEGSAAVEKKANAAYKALMLEDSKKEEADDKKRRANEDPKKDSAAVNENKGNIVSSEYPPYAGPELRAELEKETPSIPAVETILKKEYVYQSETLNAEGGGLGGIGGLLTSSSSSKSSSKSSGEMEAGSLEKLQFQTILTYENARALARRALDLSKKSDEDAKDIENENQSRSSTGSMQKGISSASIFRTHMVLNEIAVLRNSYIEINAINIIQGVEAPKKKGLVDGLLGSALGG